MLSEPELQAMYDYLSLQNKSKIVDQLRKDHSKGFDEYVAQVMEDKFENDLKKSIQLQKSIAVMVEILPYPKKSIEYPGSVFNLLEPILKIKAASIKNYYYKHKEFSRGVAITFCKYKNNDPSLNPNLKPLLQCYLDEAEKIIDMIHPYIPDS